MLEEINVQWHSWRREESSNAHGDKAALLRAIDSAIYGRGVELTYKMKRRAKCCI